MEHPQNGESPISFGQRYAILNLDLMSMPIDAAKTVTKQGQAPISNVARWNDAGYGIEPRRLRLSSRILRNRN